jgi:hypothetical protein
MIDILPYLERRYDPLGSYIPMYVSPADPTFGSGSPEPTWTPSSYAANALVFSGRPSFPNVLADGTTNTILFAEHYLHCGVLRIDRSLPNPVIPPVNFDYTETEYAMNIRRPSFADGGPVFGGRNPKDVYPITEGSPPVTRPSLAGVTFQVAPSGQDCDPSQPQTPHRSGMIVGRGDGGVRTIRPGVTPEVFWAAVTPAGGEVVGSDW